MVLAAALTLVVGLGVAACGGGSSSTSSSSGSASTGNDAPGSEIVSADGETVKTMTVTAVNSTTGAWPEAKYVAEAYASWVNAHGGIGGRELDMIFCDSEGTSAGLARCAQKAVSENVVAVVGGFLIDATAMTPVLEQAGIAWLGSPGVTPDEYTSKISFPTSGLFGWEAGGAYEAAKQGCKKLAIVGPDVPALEITETISKNGFVAGGGDPSGFSVARYAPGATDLSTSAAEASRESDCIYGYFPGPVMPVWLEALKSVGATQRIVGYVGEITEETATKFASQLEGSIASSAYQNYHTDPKWAAFREGLKEIEAPTTLDYGGPQGQETWVSYVQFNELASEIEGELTAANFLEHATEATKVDAPGLLPTLNFTEEYKGLNGEIPRNYNSYAAFGTFKNGVAILKPGFEDMGSVIDGKAP